MSACKRHEAAAIATSSATNVSASASVSEPDPAGALATSDAIAPADSASAIASASAAPSSSADARHLAMQQALREAEEFGMIGMLGDGGDTVAPWATGTGNTIGIGTSTRLAGGHPIHTPSVRMGTLTVNGRLPPEVITRIIRQNLGRFRLCYENGLRSNPSLQGRVSTKFVIDRDGSVKMSADAGSDMPDLTVTQCVVHAHTNLSFPQPEGGIVTVTSPVIFSPGS